MKDRHEGGGVGGGGGGEARLGLVIPKGCERLDVDGGVGQVMGRGAVRGDEMVDIVMGRQKGEVRKQSEEMGEKRVKVRKGIWER